MVEEQDFFILTIIYHKYWNVQYTNITVFLTFENLSEKLLTYFHYK